MAPKKKQDTFSAHDNPKQKPGKGVRKKGENSTNSNVNRQTEQTATNRHHPKDGGQCSSAKQVGNPNWYKSPPTRQFSDGAKTSLHVKKPEEDDSVREKHPRATGKSRATATTTNVQYNPDDKSSKDCRKKDENKNRNNNNNHNKKQKDNNQCSTTAKIHDEKTVDSSHLVRPTSKSQQATLANGQNGSDVNTNHKRRPRTSDRHRQKKKFLQKMHQSQTGFSFFKPVETKPNSTPPQGQSGLAATKSDTEQSDNEEDEDPKYRRREIESNWSRYEVQSSSSSSSDDSQDSSDDLAPTYSQQSLMERLANVNQNYVTSSPKSAVEQLPATNIFYVPSSAKDDFSCDVHPEDSIISNLKNDLDDILKISQSKMENMFLNISIPTVSSVSMEGHPLFTANFEMPKVPDAPQQSIDDWLNEALNF